MDAIVVRLTSPTWTAVANVISIVGFAVAILVYLDVRRIKNFYFLAVRVPDLTGRLGKHASKISSYLNDFDGFLPEIQKELVLAEVTLRSLEAKTQGRLKESISHLVKTVRSYDPNSKDKEGLRTIYVDMIRVQAEIADRQEDQKWERSS